MSPAEARDLLAACKRQRDVWRIAGPHPSPEAVARVERDEAAAREALAAEHAPRPVTPSERDGARAVAEARDVLHVATPGSVAHRMASHVVAAHAVRVAAERERDLYRAALADAARGELPGCYECPRPATLRAEEDGRVYLACDEHRGAYEWTDTPHAEALRRALKGGAL